MSKYNRMLIEVNELLDLIKSVDGNSVTSPFSKYPQITTVKYHLMVGGALTSLQRALLHDVRLEYDRRSKGFL
jgi:hypothetical protein